MTTQPTPSRPRMQDYGIAPDAGTFAPWSDIEQKLRASRNYWIGTTRPDGRPHAMPVWGAWVQGTLFWGTGTSTVKARNLAANPAITVHLESGDDLVVIEGTATPFSYDDHADEVEPEWQRKYGMSLAEAGEGAAYFRLVPRVAFSWLEADFPNTATRWTWP